MSNSILGSTKKALGIAENDVSFDVDILMHINGVFSTLNQIGVGPSDGFSIEDATTTWDSFLGDAKKFNFVKTYMYLKVRQVFDPPTTSYLQTSVKEQITELEQRISYARELDEWVPANPVDVGDIGIIDGGGAR